MTHYEVLELVKPAIEHQFGYLAMVDEHLSVGEEYQYNNVDLAREDFTTFVHELEDEAQGIGVPPGLPAQQTYLLVKDGTIVIGELRFRPNLKLPYEKFHGHIAYNVRPLQRGKGYGTRQLALVLDEARKLRLTGVSLTVEDENPASVRIIEKNGGRLLRIIENPISGKLAEENNELVVKDVERTGERWSLYWIDLRYD